MAEDLEIQQKQMNSTLALIYRIANDSKRTDSANAIAKLIKRVERNHYFLDLMAGLDPSNKTLRESTSEALERIVYGIATYTMSKIASN